MARREGRTGSITKPSQRDHSSQMMQIGQDEDWPRTVGFVKGKPLMTLITVIYWNGRGKNLMDIHKENCRGNTEEAGPRLPSSRARKVAGG